MQGPSDSPFDLVTEIVDFFARAWPLVLGLLVVVLLLSLAPGEHPRVFKSPFKRKT